MSGRRPCFPLTTGRNEREETLLSLDDWEK